MAGQPAINRQWPISKESCILQKMPRKPNFDLFHKIKMASKLWDKSTDHGHNPISSKGDQDTSSMKINGPFLLALLRKCLEASNFDPRQNSTTIIKYIECNYNLINSKGGQDKQNFRQCPSCVLREKSWNPKFDLFHKSRWRQNEENQLTVAIT